MIKVNSHELMGETYDEFARASDKFPSFNSPHEGLAIIEEEFEELKREVFTKYRNKIRMRKEATQLGAMALRFIHDICDD